MNSSPLPKILLSILAVIAVASAVLCWRYSATAKQMRDTQRMVAQMGAQQQIFALLVNDCAEYAKRNPAMDQLLRSIGVAGQAAVPAAAPRTNKPATK